ncbi:MCP four helix bundle domain-containing protein [Actinoplanes sp. NPDC049802]|uniref:MCP four helix bundle domain-containing protein n=1 Tax=Actinoplanes sp. NPDC049802 TaxID=3154742 RepID=UPI0033D9FCCC
MCLYRFIDDRPVSVKIGVAVGAALLTAAGIGGIAFTRVSELHDTAISIRDEGLRPAAATEALRRAYMQVRINAWVDAMLAPGDDSKEHQAFVASVEAIPVAAEELRGTLTDPAAIAQVDVFMDSWNPYIEQVEGPLLQAGRTGDIAKYKAVRGDRIPQLAAQVQEALDAIVVTTQKAADDAVAEADDASEQARAVIVGALVAGVAISALLALLVSRRLLRAVHALGDVISAVADGDSPAGCRLPRTTRWGRWRRRWASRWTTSGRPWPRSPVRRSR